MVDYEDFSKSEQPFTQEEFDKVFGYHVKEQLTVAEYLKYQGSKCSLSSVVLSLFPVLKWLPKYKCWPNLVTDFGSGMTVAVMHVPQGIAYGALAAVNPIVGIYTAIYPVFVYFLMGTSRHVSMGSFAIVCLMASDSVIMYATPPNGALLESPAKVKYSPEEVSSVLCLLVGIIHILFGIARVGSLSMFLSDTLISGLTSAAAVLVLISQLKHVFGLAIPKSVGSFSAIYTIYNIIILAKKINYIALVLSLTVLSIILVFETFVKPRLQCKLPIPIDLAIMVITTWISHFLNLNSSYSIKIVGSIPTGIMAPQLPPFELLPKVCFNSLTIAIVSYSINISMAKLFAAKENYKVDANQELLACGFSNLFGAFFYCLPMATSLSRSMLQYSSGGKTQLASLFSCSVLLTVIIYFAKFFETLPYCILAAIIIARLKSMLMQISHLPEIWKRSSTDGIVWMITFVSVLLLDIPIGLTISISTALLSIIILSQKVQVRQLGLIPNFTEVYLDLEEYPVASKIPDLVLIQIRGNLHFANIHSVKQNIKEIVKSETLETDYNVHTIVLDLSSVPFISSATLSVFIDFTNELNNSFRIYLTQCSHHIFKQIKSNGFVETERFQIFPTIHDAVTYALKQKI